MISLERVNARAGKFHLTDISFTVPHGAYGIVIGPAGAGKTTLLETIAGVVPLVSGRVLLAGRDASSLAPEVRDVGIVYQHGYLFPHLTVRQNIAYGAVSDAVAEDLASRFGIDRHADRAVGALSGGERLLVALARALARQPGILLLDEPFSALDPRSRRTARRALRALYEERRFTALQVTHDFAEVGMLGDVALVVDRGKIAQQGSPESVFRHPATPYIADFLGAENVFAGVVTAAGADSSDAVSARRAVEFTVGTLTLHAVSDAPLGPAHAVIRAEEVVLSAATTASSMQNHFAGRVIELAPNGPLTMVTVDLRGHPLVAAVTARSVAELELGVGKEIVASFKTTAVHLC
jgi:molybdopterin-binding protein